MFKIKPLNIESVSDEDSPPVIRKEAQEENALAKYNKALKFQCNKDLDEAKNLLECLLEKDIPEIELRGGLPKTMSTLKYSCYLNLGSISILQGKKQQALDIYLRASELDTSDVTLWYKIGNLALELDHFKQSVYGLHKGLECNKNHWPTLDKLITLLYGMRDMVSCLWYISYALQLNENYTRGLMLRRRIYERNPATQQYYQLFNPKCIHDPPLSMEFDEEEGKELEEESLVIDRRIRELELKFETKQTETFPLQKPVEQFTWLALGESIVHMHKYLSENNISHISQIDLSTSFKKRNEHNDKEDVQNDDVDISTCKNLNTVKLNDHERVVKQTGDEIIEILNDSENEPTYDNVIVVQLENVEKPRDFTSSQEEEESDYQKSESDNPETKECNDFTLDKQSSGDDKSKIRSASRRRRNSLSFLQPWAWHAKRKSNRKMGKNERDDTIEGTLRRIIPPSVLCNGLIQDRYKQIHAMNQDDSLNSLDMYKMFTEELDLETESAKPDMFNTTSKADYFGTQQEKDDIESFINYRFECCDIMFILEKYVGSLATKWELRWPDKLRSVFIEAYDMYREHFDHPPPFSTEYDFAELKLDAEMTLCYAELLFDALQSSTLKDKYFPCNSMGALELICSRAADWGDDFTKVCLRLHWLKANIFMNENKSELAIRSLNNIIYFIHNDTSDPNKYFLHLPNCTHNPFITLQNTEKLLKSFQMIQNLETVMVDYENGNYEKVVEILKDTFNHKSTTPYKIKTDRPVQIFILLHALWLTDCWQCLTWCEVCLNESLPQYLKTYAQPDSKEHKRWGMVVVKCLVMMEACIQEETIIVVDCLKDTQTRLVENLAAIICYQINCKTTETDNKMPIGSVKPWILLHYVLQRHEHRIQARSHSKKSDYSDDEPQQANVELFPERHIPSSIEILFAAHEFLGKRGWCLESGGELLLFIVQVVLYRLNAPIFEGIRDKMEIHMEQTFFCLFQHPSKKNKVSRHLADHNVNPLPLTWEYAQQLYEFYRPKVLPEFDSYKNSSITNDMEQLLLRILALVPPDYDPQPLIPRVNKFVTGQEQVLPEPLDFPFKVADIYYLLGDYYLKLHDPAKGQRYFMLDLCINPSRLDTWADLALGMASQLETKLNHCESFRNESEFLDKVKTAQVCFKQSMQISDGHATLWIEYGNFVYMSHSYCSRLLKGDTEMLSMEKFETLESQKEAMLDTAHECFSAANIAWNIEENEHDERWLHHYMLGKIAEKRKQDPACFLEHYHKAGKLLLENKATYPLKINFSNPQHLSMEALEIHYRIHASLLKYLELHEDKPLPRTMGKIFHKYLKEANNGLFSNPVQPATPAPTEVGVKRLSTDSDVSVVKRRKLADLTIFEDVASTLEDMLKTLDLENKKSPDEPNDKGDEIMIIDSDEESNIASKRLQSYREISKCSVIQSEAKTNAQQSKPKIPVKNAQEIMDDMMKKCMANQPEYKSETETDAENEIEKIKLPPLEKDQASRRASTTSTAATTTTSDSSSSSSSEDSSSSFSSSDSESSETESSKSNSGKNKTKSKTDDAVLSQEELKKLIDQCLCSLEQCAARFPQNYKALYRLTHFYLNNKGYKDLPKCRQLMLTEYQCTDSTVLTGLFNDRKPNNFFNGVWRIPTSEIDRPGSFAAHMSRCVQLLMQVLRQTDDHKILLDLCLTLRKTPDPDKIYIRDAERIQLSDQALSLSIQALRELVKRMTLGTKIYQTEPEADVTQPGQETSSQLKLVMDMYRAYMKVQKYLPQKEATFSALFVETYKHYMQNKIPENVNVLDLAVKFGQQRRAAQQMTLMQQQPAPASTSKLMSTPPPQFPAQTSSSVNVPLRKTGKGTSGRPRGRPPNINKHLMGVKPMKTKEHNFLSPQNPYSWLYSQAMGGSMEANTAINIMVSKYQEELLRQYTIGNSNPALTNPFTGKNSSVKPNPVKPSTQNTEVKLNEKLKYSEPQKELGGNLSMFKDRPGISITPIQAPSLPIVSTSPGKTLQQKLAERQKQNPHDIMNQLQSQAQKHMSFTKLPSASTAIKSIPSSLTITKTLPPAESGMSISQVSGYKMDKSSSISFRRPDVPKSKPAVPRKLGSEITVTPNITVSKPSTDNSDATVTDRVEIITIE